MSISVKVVLALLLATTSGCGTSLVVHGGDRGTLGSLPGVAVNTRRSYVGKVVFHPVEREASISLQGASVDQVMYLSTRRMPFASGKLTLELDAQQFVKKVGITSDSGLQRGLDSVTQVVDARNTIRAADDDADAEDSSDP